MSVMNDARYLHDAILPANVPTFIKHLNAEDPVGLVIRAHLYVESALIRIIESALVNKAAVDVARMRFASKVEFAYALGKLSEDARRACSVLNRLRNDCAHDLDSQLNEQAERDFYNALSEKLRDTVEPGLITAKEMGFMTRLRLELIVFIGHMEWVAQAATKGGAQGVHLEQKT